MKDNASTFNVSNYYEKIKMTLPYYEDFYKQVIDVVKIQFDRPLRWLNVGCGTVKMAEAVRKCYNALRTNGMFITFENFVPFSEYGKALFLNRWREYQLYQGKSAVKCDNHINRYGKDYFPISISEHLEVLNNCGFKGVEILWAQICRLACWV